MFWFFFSFFFFALTLQLFGLTRRKTTRSFLTLPMAFVLCCFPISRVTSYFWPALFVSFFFPVVGWGPAFHCKWLPSCVGIRCCQSQLWWGSRTWQVFCRWPEVLVLVLVLVLLQRDHRGNHRKCFLLWNLPDLFLVLCTCCRCCRSDIWAGVWCTCLYMYAHVYVEVRGQRWLSSSLVVSHLSFDTGSLTELTTGLASEPQGGIPQLIPLCWDCKCVLSNWDFYLCVGDMNLGPRTHPASALLLPSSGPPF